jgi:hypothetical protein
MPLEAPVTTATRPVSGPAGTAFDMENSYNCERVARDDAAVPAQRTNLGIDNRHCCAWDCAPLCHGPAALHSASQPGGRWLSAGKPAQEG